MRAAGVHRRPAKKNACKERSKGLSLTGFCVVAAGGVVEEQRVADGDLADALVHAPALLGGVALLEQAAVDQDVGELSLPTNKQTNKNTKQRQASRPYFILARTRF